MTLDEMLEAAKRPGLFLRKTPTAQDLGAPGCWLGGAPTLPEDIDWPMFERDRVPAVPMRLLAQIDLAEVPRFEGFPAMPAKGTLFFFHEPILAPLYGSEHDSARVLYTIEDVSLSPPRTMPPIPDAVDEFEASIWSGDKPDGGYHRWPITFGELTLYDTMLFGPAEFWEAASGRELAERDRIEALTSADRKPQASELALHRIFGNDGLGSVRPDDDWVPLLTIEADRDLGFTYGDDSPVVFMITADALAVGDFSKVYFSERST